ncbi:MAG: hypothetical protein HQ518_04710 [Rhodopirellula sp.]|nr:hypothetical protein [Rhodopirellula sp.]
MNSVIPATFSFRFALPLQRVDALPLKGKQLLKLDENCRLFWPGSDLSEVEQPLQLSAAWNPQGIAIAAQVSRKQHPAVSDINRPDETDAVQIWINTRNTTTIHRANRLCHHFCLLPNGGGDDGLEPVVRQLPIARATEDATIFPPEAFTIRSERSADGYIIEAWLPAECLNGFDATESKQLAFYAMLRDSELGDHCLTVDSAFPFASDPSLWQTLDLQDA